MMIMARIGDALKAVIAAVIDIMEGFIAVSFLKKKSEPDWRINLFHRFMPLCYGRHRLLCSTG